MMVVLHSKRDFKWQFHYNSTAYPEKGKTVFFLSSSYPPSASPDGMSGHLTTPQTVKISFTVERWMRWSQMTRSIDPRNQPDSGLILQFCFFLLEGQYTIQQFTQFSTAYPNNFPCSYRFTPVSLLLENGREEIRFSSEEWTRREAGSNPQHAKSSNHVLSSIACRFWWPKPERYVHENSANRDGLLNSTLALSSNTRTTLSSTQDNKCLQALGWLELNAYLLVTDIDSLSTGSSFWVITYFPIFVQN